MARPSTFTGKQSGGSQKQCIGGALFFHIWTSGALARTHVFQCFDMSKCIKCIKCIYFRYLRELVVVSKVKRKVHVFGALDALGALRFALLKIGN